ncbi:alpha/beta hydrolase [Streptomyces sp. NPDC048680]|uniref:alpha/beta hydrolase n=1 Tax=Streptomyces sp. NPDC048680 TaxID=3155492 RepID=UPI00343168B9
MRTPAERQRIRFDVDGTECAAWHYPGTNGGCVIMAGGGGVTKEPGTDLFAARFHEAGFTVLAFDYRYLGESGGLPRQVVRIKDQLTDWQSAIDCAATLPGVAPARIAIWGFSLSGGHVLRVAARNPHLAAAVAQTPNADGPACARNATRCQKPLAMLGLTGTVLRDAAGALLGRRPVLVPLAGRPGTVAMLTTPDSVDSDRVLNPRNRYPEWQQVIAARSVFGITLYRPGRDAPRIRVPLLVLVCDQDRTALSEPAVRAAGRASGAELVRFPGGHYAPFLDEHEPALRAELSFLHRHLLDPVPAGEPAAADASPARRS